jgi:hypothetical protein
MRSGRREFSKETKRLVFERAGGHCESCTAPLRPGKFDYDHVIPDALGGEPTPGNCTVLCRACHDLKTFRSDIPAIAKSNRVRDLARGIRKTVYRPLPGTRASGIKKPMHPYSEPVDRATGLPLFGRRR